MKVYICMIAVLFMAQTAHCAVTKCYKAAKDGTPTSTACPDGEKDLCAKISLKSDNYAKSEYKCVKTSDKNSIVATPGETLTCKNLTTANQEDEYCYCTKDDCNAPPTTASTLKCYVGAAAAEGKDAKANTTCGSGEDRCYTKTDKDKKIETKCFKSADIKTDTMKDLECMEKDSEKICLCKTDNCNNPSGAAGPVLVSVVQIFALIVFSSILRLGMS